LPSPDLGLTIGREAFTHTGIASLTIPTGLKSLESKTFYRCGALESINFQGTELKTIKYVGEVTARSAESIRRG
jgi:hypothetical protein